MKIAFVFFERITLLVLIGIYDPVSRLQSIQYLPDLSWVFCSFTSSLKDNFGLEIISAKINESLAGYDGIIISGGHGTRRLQTDNQFLDWIKIVEKVTYKMSICTGG